MAYCLLSLLCLYLFFFLLKRHCVYISKYNVSEIGFCLISSHRESKPSPSCRNWIFKYYGPGIDSASNRNEDHVGVKVGRCVRLTTLPSSVSWSSRICVSLDVSQTYGPPRPVTGIDLLLPLKLQQPIKRLISKTGPTDCHYRWRLNFYVRKCKLKTLIIKTVCVFGSGGGAASCQSWQYSLYIGYLHHSTKSWVLKRE
jgi:hypothetical protein